MKRLELIKTSISDAEVNISNLQTLRI